MSFGIRRAPSGLAAARPPRPRQEVRFELMSVVIAQITVRSANGALSEIHAPPRGLLQAPRFDYQRLDPPAGRSTVFLHRGEILLHDPAPGPKGTWYRAGTVPSPPKLGP